MTQHDSNSKKNISGPVSISRNFEKKNLLEESFEESGVAENTNPERVSEKKVFDRREVLRNLLPLAGKATVKAMRKVSLGVAGGLISKENTEKTDKIDN